MTLYLKDAPTCSKATVSRAVLSLEYYLVHNCALVLDAAKPSALFSWPYTVGQKMENGSYLSTTLTQQEFDSAFFDVASQLEDTGIEMRVLAYLEEGAQVFVFRRDLLQIVLSQHPTPQILADNGYPVPDLVAMLDHLANRTKALEDASAPFDFNDYPHEIGFFLGYPAIDVAGYIQNEGAGAILEGPWKVYGCSHRAAAMQTAFSQIAECEAAYIQSYEQGAKLHDLAMMGVLSKELS